MAKFNVREDLDVNDRVIMRKGSPIKEGTVRIYDEEEALVKWDDGEVDWIPLFNIYITRKGSEIKWANGSNYFTNSEGEKDV